MITIAIANHKGGVGKTTTTYWLGRCLAEAGHSTTLIDLDPQANLTAAFGFDATPPGVVEVLRAGAPILTAVSAVLVPGHGNLAVLRSAPELSDMADDLTIKQLGVLRLRSALERYAADIEDDEIVLVDCPPNVGALTYSALIAADYVIVPTQPAPWSFEGVGRIWAKCDEVGEALGRKPTILGTVATLVDSRVSEHKAGLLQMTQGKLPLLGHVARREGKDAEAALHDAYLLIAEVVAARLESW